MQENGVPDDETLARVGEEIDLDSFIAYHALQIFVGNADTLNVKRYRNQNADGKWHWAIFDLDWGFYVDTNSIRRWLDPDGMGSSNATDNTLFIALMNNPTFYDRFLTYMGEMLATEWTSGPHRGDDPRALRGPAPGDARASASAGGRAERTV